MKFTDFKAVLAVLACLFLAVNGFSQGHDEASSAGHDNAAEGCGIKHEEAGEYDPGANAFHHIADQNIYTIGPWYFPLPCILYAKDKGLSVFSSGRFHCNNHHGNGTTAYQGYVLAEGKVRRVNPALHPNFPMGEVPISGFSSETRTVKDQEKEITFACYDNALYELESSTTADGGLFGGGFTSFYDFSVTKDVLAMLLAAFLLGWLFFAVAKAYRRREGMPPKGVQSLIEPMYIFIRDDVAKAMIGHKYERYMPFILSLFFFVLALNLIGQIPFLGNPNITGNLAVTMTLAIFTFFVTNLSGNRHYWQHVFWMPGIPAVVKLLILTPIEFIGLFLKPITLTVRLFSNIIAGHIVILSFVGLIFIFGKMGANPAGGYVGAVLSVLFSLFMSSLELLVAFIQAFIFAILSASYIGMAVEEHH